MKDNKPARPYEFMRAIFSSPTMVAIGIDPKTQTFHACIKGANFERKWSEPLTPQIRAVVGLIKGLLS